MLSLLVDKSFICSTGVVQLWTEASPGARSYELCCVRHWLKPFYQLYGQIEVVATCSARLCFFNVWDISLFGASIIWHSDSAFPIVNQMHQSSHYFHTLLCRSLYCFACISSTDWCGMKAAPEDVSNLASACYIYLVGKPMYITYLIHGVPGNNPLS